MNRHLHAAAHLTIAACVLAIPFLDERDERHVHDDQVELAPRLETFEGALELLRARSWDLYNLAGSEESWTALEVQGAFLIQFKQTDAFRNVPANYLMGLADVSKEIEAKTGELLYREGDASENVFIVVGGGITLRRQGAVIGRLGPLESMGELALLDNAPRSTEAEAGEEFA